jgi:predicted PhzF superfamily epimerase YddE/YHI9
MKIRIFQVDAFTERVFHRNPAAVCPLETWLPDELMQQIAMENNLAETAFVTAPGDESDFVSRFFAPQSGIDEDPVTGSAHTTLTPYWAAKLGKNELTAQQLSSRRGWLKCRLEGDRVKISGQARAYMSGEIELE